MTNREKTTVMTRKRSGRRQRGAVVVETAVIMILLTSLVFAIFEYGRLLMVWSLLNNAAREGCRYALVNNTSSTINSDVKALVTSYMAGQTSSFQTSSFSVSVTGTTNGVPTAVNNLEPGDPITVTVSGKFRFMNIIPLAQMPTSWTMTSSVTMLCEGGT
jgi:Flp pilus assembly protein TadG